MPCPLPPVLEALLADELSQPVEAALDEHIVGCPSCQQALEELTRASDPRQLRGGDTADSEETRLQSGPFGSSGRLVASAAAFGPTPLPTIPGYQIQGELGRGGRGVVYRARQLQLNRTVAVKMLRAGGQADAGDRARSQAEAEAVARLQHPNIVQIHDTGVADGQPFFALEYVDGGTLAQHTHGTPQPPRAAAAVVEILARAIQAAHDRGVLHRDLKPSNVLLSRTAAGDAAAQGDYWSLFTAKITDFGLAKFLDHDSDLTQSRDILGTPSYMAPEQAKAEHRAIGPATDVYALGAILYELLTGKPPFVGETPYDTVLQVVQEEPVPPRALQRKVPRDLETICLQCLQKTPGQRYATAQALADDLRRFLNHEPIRARPTPLTRRAVQWTRRRPLLAGALAVTVLLTGLALAGLSAATVEARRAEQVEIDRRKQESELREAAEHERRRAERLSAYTLLDLAISRSDGGDLDRGLHLFVRTAELAQTLADPDLDYAARANLACWQPYYLRAWGELHHKDWVWAVTFSPDGKRVATASKDRTARVWDAATGEPLTPPLGHAEPVWSVAFSPDGQQLLTGSGQAAGAAQLWDVATGKAVGPPLPHTQTVMGAAFSPDGATFLTMCDAGVQVWDSAKRERRGPLLRHEGEVHAAVFSPGGDLIATTSSDRTARLWRTSSGEEVHVLRHPGPVLAAAFSPKGDLLLTGCLYPPRDDRNQPSGGAGRLWQVATGQAVGPPLVHQGAVRAVAFRPDGAQAVTAGAVSGNPAEPRQRGEARLWFTLPDDPTFGKPVGPAMPHPGVVRSVVFSPSGHTILTGAEDLFARLWSAGTGQLLATSSRQEGTVSQVAYAPDGRTLLTASANAPAAGRLWSAPPELAGATLPMPGHLLLTAISPNGQLAVTGMSQSGTFAGWELPGGRRRWQKELHPGAFCWSAAFAPDGRTLITGIEGVGGRGELYFWDAANGEALGPPRIFDEVVRGVDLSADGNLLVTGTAKNGKIAVWDARTMKLQRTLDHPQALRVHLSPDQRHLLTGGLDGSARLWETATGKLLHSWPTSANIQFLQFSPESTRALLALDNGIGQIWNIATNQPAAAARIQAVSMHAIVAHPDRRSIITGTVDGRVQRWDVALGKTIGPAVRVERDAAGLSIADNGMFVLRQHLIAAGTVHQAPRAAAGSLAEMKLAVEVLTGKAMDAEGVLHELPRGAWQARRQELARLGRDPLTAAP